MSRTALLVIAVADDRRIAGRGGRLSSCAGEVLVSSVPIVNEHVPLTATLYQRPRPNAATVPSTEAIYTRQLGRRCRQAVDPATQAPHLPPRHPHDPYGKISPRPGPCWRRPQPAVPTAERPVFGKSVGRLVFRPITATSGDPSAQVGPQRLEEGSRHGPRRAPVVEPAQVHDDG